jgi:hypothetical protein
MAFSLARSSSFNWISTRFIVAYHVVQLYFYRTSGSFASNIAITQSPNAVLQKQAAFLEMAVFAPNDPLE